MLKDLGTRWTDKFIGLLKAEASSEPIEEKTDKKEECAMSERTHTIELNAVIIKKGVLPEGCDERHHIALKILSANDYVHKRIFKMYEDCPMDPSTDAKRRYMPSRDGDTTTVVIFVPDADEIDMDKVYEYFCSSITLSLDSFLFPGNTLINAVVKHIKVPGIIEWDGLPKKQHKEEKCESDKEPVKPTDEYYRKKFVFKNEFRFSAKALIAKKMYASSMFVQEGSPRDIHDIAISGLSFKKRDAEDKWVRFIEDMEKMFNRQNDKPRFKHMKFETKLTYCDSQHSCANLDVKCFMDNDRIGLFTIRMNDRPNGGSEERVPVVIRFFPESEGYCQGIYWIDGSKHDALHVNKQTGGGRPFYDDMVRTVGIKFVQFFEQWLKNKLACINASDCEEEFESPTDTESIDKLTKRLVANSAYGMMSRSFDECIKDDECIEHALSYMQAIDPESDIAKKLKESINAISANPGETIWIDSLGCNNKTKNSGGTTMRGTSISIEKLFFNGSTTIVMWTDGTKTVVQPIEGEKFDPEIGIAMAIARKIFGSRHQFDKFVDEKVRDLAIRNAKEFTDKELATLIVEHSATIAAAKKKHAADKEAYNAAKAAGEKKLPVLSGLKSDRRYRYAKIMIDAFTAEQEDRKRKKAARAACAKKDTKKPTTAKKSSTRKKSTK